MAFAIVLNVWGIQHNTISILLTGKRAEIRGLATVPKFERTVNSVRTKLQRVREQNPELWLEDQHHWNKDAVCNFLRASNIDGELLYSLLNLTEDDIKIILEVRPFTILL